MDLETIDITERQNLSSLSTWLGISLTGVVLGIVYAIGKGVAGETKETVETGLDRIPTF